MIRSPSPKPVHDPDEDVDIHSLIDDVVPNPEEWKNAPNETFEGKSPAGLIGTEKEQALRDLLRAIKHGMTS
jgi:hypothetical protein